MSKPTIRILLGTVIGTALSIIVTTFVMWGFHPAEWTTEGRTFFIIITIFATVVAHMFLDEVE